MRMKSSEHIQLNNRPLVVCDIDEVVLEFLTPFNRFLQANGHTLLPRSFRLHGNIVSIQDGLEATHETVDALEDGFYADQANWQFPAVNAVETLHALSNHADIVFLTAMPPKFHAQRRQLLDRTGLFYPMLSTEEPKGKVLQELHGDRDVPVFFIDDIARNLESVGSHIPSCHLLHLMANSEFRKLAPKTSDSVLCADDWNHAKHLILSRLSVPLVAF